MKAQTVRTTANNLIEALTLDAEMAKRVAKYELKRFGTEDDAKATIKRHNEKCDAMIYMLSMLYITAYDGKQINKMGDELTAQQNRVYDLRLDFWNDVQYAE